MRNYEIRNATTGDLDDLVILLKELFSIEADFNFDETLQKKGLLLMLDGCGKHRVVKVADVDGKVTGMVTVQILISTAEGRPAGIVEDLVVLDGYRGQGIGTALLDAVDAWALQHGIERLQLLADKTNARALDFYTGRNWKVTQLICLRKRYNPKS